MSSLLILLHYYSFNTNAQCVFKFNLLKASFIDRDNDLQVNEINLVVF